jgi:NAD-dependent dihydropyrimidine dehydrogenase PreA subunit
VVKAALLFLISRKPERLPHAPTATGEVSPVAEYEPKRRLRSGCHAVRPVEEFNFKRRAAGVRHSYCRECGRRITKSHYERNKQSYLDRNARAYRRHRELIRQAKSRPCADCGVRCPYYVMDFDHRDGATKAFMLSDVARATSKSLLREIEKCDVVCSNCHSERTHRRMMSKGRIK